MRLSSRPIRLLLVTDSLNAGGAERHVVDLALALRREGHEVTVACSVAGPLSDLLESEAVPVRPLLNRLVKRRVSVAYARRLRKLLKQESFDLVHAHVYASAAAAAIATLRTRVPLVITEHTEAPWRNQRARLTSRWVYKRTEQVIAVSTPIRQLLIGTYAVPPEHVTFIPNAVVADSGASSDTSSALPAACREGPLIGRVARLQPEKGMTIFLEAAARVSPLFPKAHFLVIGDGPLRQELEALAERLSLTQRIHFLGFRSDARALIELLDVLVVSSLSDGAPLVILEAMEAGIPVVASAVGGIPDQIRHEREGLLVPPGDSAALADALLTLLRDPAYARSLGEAGRKRADFEFSYATMVQRIKAVYETILSQRTARSVAREETEPKVS